MKKFLLLALILMVNAAYAASPNLFPKGSMLNVVDPYEQCSEWYANHCEEALLRFEGIRHDGTKQPARYCLMPTAEAAPLDYALVIASADDSEVVMFTPNGNALSGRPVQRSLVGDSIYWEGISHLGRTRTPALDITLREHPIPVRTYSKSSNTFHAVMEASEGIGDIRAYTQMIFKPHHNAVTLAKQERDYRTDEEGRVLRDETAYTFNLRDRSVMSRMFAGYDDQEASPWIVKDSFFRTHELLPFSRWKFGEPVRKASSDVCKLISYYYGGRAIADTKWVADIPSGERHFYVVQFEPVGRSALAALVCVAEGEVVSTWDFPGEYTSDGSVWFVDDEGDFMEHAPEIHAIAVTDEGMELYVRLFGGESVQYYILREMRTTWMEIYVNYWIYVWD